METRCATGERLAYFGALWPGCGGFYPDGSVRFDSFRPPANQKAARVLKNALEQYGAMLRLTGGQPDRDYLDRLAGLSTELRASRSRLILVLPPLFPGVESGLAAGPEGVALARLKAVLSEWAQANDVEIIDGGRSEDAGCNASEFVDGHHALTSCYAKVFEGALSHSALELGSQPVPRL